MKKFASLSVAILFLLTLTVFSTAQEPVPPKVPNEVPKPMPKPMPKPTPPTEKTDKTEEDVAETEDEEYDVPLIGTEDFKEGKANLSAEIEGLEAKALLEKGKDEGTTLIKISFSNLNKIAKDKIFFLWISTSDGEYKKVGEVSYSEKNANSEISGLIPLDKFGLFLTAEDGKVEKPTSKTYSAFSQDADG